MTKTARSLGVYVHVPFCARRCSYCDFATVAGRDGLIERYLDALVRELTLCQRELPRQVDTVFFGGGTPSRMRPEQVRRLLDATGLTLDAIDLIELNEAFAAQVLAVNRELDLDHERVNVNASQFFQFICGCFQFVRDFEQIEVFLNRVDCFVLSIGFIFHVWIVDDILACQFNNGCKGSDNVLLK